MRIPGLKFLLVLGFALTLAACDSPEEQAEKHYQSALSLLEGDETAKALVELRNVFRFNGAHREARTLYAGLLRERGNTQQSYSQYLRLVEQYPDDLEGRLALAEMAFDQRNWDEFERHGTAALEITTQGPRLEAISIALQYRQATLDEDRPALDALTEQARTHPLAEAPLLRVLLIDSFVTAGAYDDALEKLDGALAEAPENRVWQNLKLTILLQLEDVPDVIAHLKQMIDVFPEDDELKSTLLRVYVSRGLNAEAEEYLRTISDPTAEDPSYFLSLIEFLVQTKSVEVGLAELEPHIASGPNALAYTGVYAGLLYEVGKEASAITLIEVRLAGLEETTDQSLNLQLLLARLFVREDNEVAARKLVEDVLSKRPEQPDALKLRANWQIEADDTDAAIAALREVLAQRPEDVEALTLTAQAYRRSGSHELARDFLALAVEASQSAPAPTLRYVALLLENENYLPAEDTLLSALRLAPNNIDLLRSLGSLYLRMDDAGRTRQVIETLRRLDTDEGRAAALQIEIPLIRRTEGADNAVNFLEQLAQENDGDVRYTIASVQAMLQAGQAENATDLARQAAEASPGDPTLAYLLASTYSATGDLGRAEGLYRQLLDRAPDSARLWRQLALAVGGQGRLEEAEALIDEAIGQMPDNLNLSWAKASMREQMGDLDEAIAIYERMYEAQSDSLVIANNLASLMSVQSNDPETVERAYTIARRLRGTDIAPFQDTYGWIAFLRGETEEAIRYLEPAAQVLGDDPLVQYHLGRAYLAEERLEEARASFVLAISLFDESRAQPQLADARRRIEEIEAAQAAREAEEQQTGGTGQN